MATLLAQDVRLAAVADQMLVANNALCRLHMPVTGLIFHSRDQYSADVAGTRFVNGAIVIEAIVPGSTADSAGLMAGDGLVSIGSQQTGDLVKLEDNPLRDSAYSALADLQGQPEIALTFTRAGREFTVNLPAPQGCRALVEIRSLNDLSARSDGRVIQVSYGLAAEASDAELAVVFAHEMGHLVLEHRRRLEAAGVEKGFFGEFGKNQRLNRQVEVEADRMSVHLLANAGYDPAIAPAFWRTSLGRRAGGGLLRSSTYPSPETRAQLIEREISDYLGAGSAPTWPGHLLGRRDTGFD
ncbi:MAG: M48 family metallopeptidase [Croceibacterium sp.]